MPINISYACNEAYMEQTTVSLVSLFENCSVPDQLHIYFVDMGVDESSQSEMRSLIESYGAELSIVPFDEIAYDLNISATGRHIKSVYAKLFFGRLAGVERIIYLDSDTVIAGDIRELWDVDLEGNVCAGVETIHSIADNQRIGYSATDRAINDGIVLMDLARWRREDYLKLCQDYIEQNNGEPPVLSEGTINAVCKERIKILHPRYNLLSGLVGASSKKIEKLTGRKYYTQEEINEANEDPCIIHFLSAFYNRPWCQNCSHPMKKEYLKYRMMTKWADTPLQNTVLPARQRLIGAAFEWLPVGLFSFLRWCFGSN